MNDKKFPYEMTLSLNILRHLGINLYSNVPSVLSEVVANAWDADATEVRVFFDKDAGKITITDNGVGMTQRELNEHYLKVGYQRREGQPGLTPARGRLPMGRKGIGKLSLLSIADVIDVFSAKDGEKNGLRISRAEIEKSITGDDEGLYQPDEIPVDEFRLSQGTMIVLTALRRRQSIATAKALRQRVARRFSIIGPKHRFEVFVNNEKITPEDRGYHAKLQYLWTYGDIDIAERCENLSRAAEKRETPANEKGIAITGWLGAVRESKQLKDAESEDNLNRIAIFVRGKMAQEDILGDFGERGVYATYLVGELQVERFDEDNEDDAATSSRQSLVEDDPRYKALKKIIGLELKHIQNKWSEWRTDDGAKDAMKIPELDGWVSGLPASQRSGAKGWLGRIYRVRTNSPEERKQLLKHAVFAFEFFRANKDLEALEKIDDHNLDALVKVIHELDSLEFNLYGQIVKQRVAVIHTLQEKVDKNEKELVIHKILFDHLWLLDPHWERVDASAFMEQRVGRLFGEVDAQLTQEEKDGRLDIKYRKSAGTHIIVELKRPNRVVNLPETFKQVQKYFNGVSKLLEAQNVAHEPVEIVLVLGKKPAEWANPGEKERFKGALEKYNVRVVFYDELLASAYRCYADYLEREKQYNRIQEVIQAIEDFETTGQN